jgi:HEPN domain-containing protein
MATTDEGITNWLRFAEADMISAEALHDAGQDLNSIFHLQQAVEKTLKALFLRQTKEEPPRIHGLRKLAERCAIALTAEQSLLLENLSEYYVESRYPGEWRDVPPEVISSEAERLIPAAREFIQWLRSRV